MAAGCWLPARIHEEVEDGCPGLGDVSIGIWAAVAPFLFPWDVCAWVWAAGIVPGVLVALMSIWFAASTPKKRWAWLCWLCAVLGVWLIVSPFVAGYSIVSDVTWSNFVPGALIVLLGAVTGWQAQTAE